LPFQLTSLVGRQRETSEVEGLLAERRLLTLTGPGGSGKTRLALAVASDVVEDYEYGTWLVELAPLSDPELVAQAVASVLGVSEQPGRALMQTLAEALTDNQMLLVLDNCEHLIEACASLAGTLLSTCQNLSILATSREALGITGESSCPSLLFRCPTPATCRPSKVCPATKRRSCSSSGPWPSSRASRSRSKTLWRLRKCATASTECPWP